jgi:GABA(A) receptor-associated protein
MPKFKESKSLEKRINESRHIITKYPERIPIICERGENSNMPVIDKAKYLVPSDLTMGQFLYIIRKRIKLNSEKAMFIFMGGKIPPTSVTVGQIYEENKDEDGFLYLTYTGENTFG